MDTGSMTGSNMDYLAILIQFLVVLSFVGITIILTHLLGPKRKNEEKLSNFECGIESIGDARLPYSVKYFLAAILFVLFDIEIIFFYPWAVNFKELGMSGFIKMIIFVTPFLLGYFYVIKKGVLKWH
ncbi:MAG TPA: NADH-quinone oxidoreductase subunit A [Saprospiraceae bacterium]|jgi:NADH-quinone oxidoreductase subunit A|nr:NADH-quinone oxidoreductase subunit A [Saprospiraceae bacterium]HRP40571.1 NADH-quinone oxidoreductase subunit A [Saprospiraceae bacterium]